MSTFTSTSHDQERTLSRETIASRAYELYALRGRVDGYDLNDWLAAEAELRAEKDDQDL
jgi:hypothetical protein